LKAALNWGQTHLFAWPLSPQVPLPNRREGIPQEQRLLSQLPTWPIQGQNAYTFNISPVGPHPQVIISFALKKSQEDELHILMAASI
jgi:hypothetical protein